MAVTRDYTPNNFLGSTAPVQGSSAVPTTQGGAGDGGNVLLQGNISRTGAVIGRSATVKAGEDIRPALESLKSAGGGTLILLAGVHRPSYDIVGAAKIKIIGEGVNQTIIDFGGSAFGVKYIGTSSIFLENFKLSDLTITNSNIEGGLFIEFASFWEVSNVSLESNTQNGFYIKSCRNFEIDSVTAESNGGSGFFFDSSEPLVLNTTTQFFTVSNCNTNNNTGSGFKFNVYGFSGGAEIQYFTFSNCISAFDDGNGFEFLDDVDTVSSDLNAKFIGCLVQSPGDYSLLIQTEISGLTFVGCDFASATIASVFVQGSFNSFVACSASGRIQAGPFPGWKITGESNVITSSNFSTQSFNSGIENEDFNEIIDSLTISKNNNGASFATTQDLVNVTNTSGGTLSAGTVVIHKSTSSGDEVTTTTTQGDDKVCGVLVESLTNNSDGFLLTLGKTKLLKVNGTTDIAIGDFLCTYTVAGISAKAGSGDMAFAIALEAYTANDSSGVIDALLISPRKI